MQKRSYDRCAGGPGYAGEVGHDAAVDRTEPRHAVPATTDRRGESVLMREGDRGSDVCGAGAVHDGTGP